MTKIEVSKATGLVLNHIVAVAMGYPDGFPENLLGVEVAGFGHKRVKWNPSDNWAQAGPLIERENISITNQHGCRGVAKWMASLYIPDNDCTMIMFGPTALVTAMRCYVASRLGEVVEVPDELLGDQPK